MFTHRSLPLFSELSHASSNLLLDFRLYVDIRERWLSEKPARKTCVVLKTRIINITFMEVESLSSRQYKYTHPTVTAVDARLPPCRLSVGRRLGTKSKTPERAAMCAVTTCLPADHACADPRARLEKPCESDNHAFSHLIPVKMKIGT